LERLIYFQELVQPRCRNVFVRKIRARRSRLLNMTNKRKQVTAANRRARQKEGSRRLIARLEAADEERATVSRHCCALEENNSTLHAELLAARRDLDLLRSGDVAPNAHLLPSVMASAQLAEAALGLHDFAHRPVSDGPQDSPPRSLGSTSPGHRGTSPGSPFSSSDSPDSLRPSPPAQLCSPACPRSDWPGEPYAPSSA
jgi:hypothetical protein